MSAATGFSSSERKEIRSLSLKPRSDSTGELEPLTFVKADEQRAEMFAGAYRLGISADHELLLLV
jgi:hypothetical protein